MDNMEMIKDVIRMAWKTHIKTVILLCDTKNIKTVVNAVRKTMPHVSECFSNVYKNEIEITCVDLTRI